MFYYKISKSEKFDLFMYLIDLHKNKENEFGQKI